MLVIDKPILTDLARALRHELASHGIPLGHQATLNICTGVLGVRSSHKALAILDARPLLVGTHDREAWTPSAIVTQLARLAHSEANLRLKSGRSREWMSAELNGIIDASCIAMRASVDDGSGQSRRALRMSNSNMAGSPDHPYVLEVRPEPHPDGDAINGHLMTFVDRLHGLLQARTGGSAEVPRETAASCMQEALQKTALRVDRDDRIYRNILALAGDRWDAGAWSAEMLAMLDGRQPIAGLAHVLLQEIAGPFPVGIHWPDGHISNLEACLVGGRWGDAQPGNLPAAQDREPHPKTESGMPSPIEVEHELWERKFTFCAHVGGTVYISSPGYSAALAMLDGQPMRASSLSEAGDLEAACEGYALASGIAPLDDEEEEFPAPGAGR